MARSSAKLMALEAEPDPACAALTAALARVDEAKATIADNEAQQAEARVKIGDAEVAADKAEKALASAPALQRRAVRLELQSATEDLTDWRDHLAELQKKATASFNGLNSRLQDAENEVKAARRELLQGHPHVVALLQRLQELRAETRQITSDLAALDAVGGLGAEGWASNSAPNPQPSRGLVEWINELMVNPNAEISE